MSVTSGVKILCTKLHNGVLLPAVGFGTWTVSDPENCKASVRAALAAGYRHIDTASAYANEHLMGPVIADFDAGKTTEDKADKRTPVTEGCSEFSVVDESEFRDNFRVPIATEETKNRKVFVTTKVPPKLMNPEGIRQVVEEHQKAFNRDVVDLVLLHWPAAAEVPAPGDFETNHRIRVTAWKTLESLHSTGKIRAIGVSNYMVKHLQPLLDDIAARKAAGEKNATVPHINQIEISPFLDVPDDLLKLCRSNGIVIESYSTLGSHRGKEELFNSPAVKEVVESQKMNATHVILRWALQRGYVVLPRSTKAPHIEDNYGVCWDKLDHASMEKLNKMDRQERYCWDPTTIN